MLEAPLYRYREKRKKRTSSSLTTAMSIELYQQLAWLSVSIQKKKGSKQ